ncbi:MAG: hypothetical protein SFX18_17235 [Pirellulales bacterium]|nr:hypothetical protein [Pirellulales bacterium]
MNRIRFQIGNFATPQARTKARKLAKTSAAFATVPAFAQSSGLLQVYQHAADQARLQILKKRQRAELAEAHAFRWN